MIGKIDYVKKHFAPLKDKTLINAIAHKIGKEFPKIGGERILNLCAEMILEVINNHIKPKEYLRHGQVLWTGISVDDPPGLNKKIINTDLVPVVLDISTADDIDLILQRKSKHERLLVKAIRLCQQSFNQGALLSNSDLSEILNIPAPDISHLLSTHEKTTKEMVPRRATIHDVGTGLTHKRIICLKRYISGKETHEIAKETYHNIESVDRYLGQFDRVRHLHQQGMRAEEIAFSLKCGVSLVNEYLEIDKEINGEKG